MPSEITVKLLCKAMEESGNDRFIIDGFPRNEENRIVFENVVRVIFHLFKFIFTCCGKPWFNNTFFLWN